MCKSLIAKISQAHEGQNLRTHHLESVFDLFSAIQIFLFGFEMAAFAAYTLRPFLILSVLETFFFGHFPTFTEVFDLFQLSQ